MTGTAEAGDRFEFAMVAADIDCNGRTDLVVGTPYEDIGGFVDTGMVQVIWGGPLGWGTGRRPASTAKALSPRT